MRICPAPDAVVTSAQCVTVSGFAVHLPNWMSAAFACGFVPENAVAFVSATRA